MRKVLLLLLIASLAACAGRVKTIKSFEDVRLALYDTVPGDPVSLDLDHPEDGRRTLSLTLY